MNQKTEPVHAGSPITISKERLNHAWQVYETCTASGPHSMCEALAADDALRLTRPELFQPSPNHDEAEPAISARFRYDEANQWYRWTDGSGRVEVGGCSPDELEQFARHARWVIAQAVRPAPPEVTDRMLAAAVRSCTENRDILKLESWMRQAIQAALAAAPTSTDLTGRSGV